MLQLIQSWSVNHTNHIPITIYLEPREATLFAGNEASINQQLASKPGAPSAYAPSWLVTSYHLYLNTIRTCMHRTLIRLYA